MVIQCQQCETMYNFDEALLANGSIDVRCVRCKNVFTVSATAPKIEPALTFQPERPSATAEQPAPAIQQEEPALPDWNNDEDSFAFAEPDSFSFDEERADQAKATDQLDNGGQFSFASAAEEIDSLPQEFSFGTSTADEKDSLPQEFSFDTIDPETEATPEQTITPTSGANEPEASVPEAATTETAKTAEKKPVRPAKDKPKTSKLAWVFLLIIMLIAGAYGYCYVTFATTDIMQMIKKVQQQFAPVPQQPQGSILVDTSESYYVENVAAGQLFIIQGYAINKFPEPRSEIKVVATLYKDKGIPLLSQSAYCGNIISKNELENLSMQELQDAANNPFGAALSNVSVAPGQSRPFMVVFAKTPESLTEFSVEAESSKAATK